jgi:hypothetical protein
MNLAGFATTVAAAIANFVRESTVLRGLRTAH